jgi:DNA-binding MarR family transcriptional regulator
VERTRDHARLFPAFVPTMAASMRASSGFAGLDWASLRVLHLLSVRDGVTVDELASLLGLDASTVSHVTDALRPSGYVR